MMPPMDEYVPPIKHMIPITIIAEQSMTCAAKNATKIEKGKCFLREN
jgi:hypothetical protein